MSNFLFLSRSEGVNVKIYTPAIKKKKPLLNLHKVIIFIIKETEYKIIRDSPFTYWHYLNLTKFVGAPKPILT